MLLPDRNEGLSGLEWQYRGPQSVISHCDERQQSNSIDLEQRDIILHNVCQPQHGSILHQHRSPFRQSQHSGNQYLVIRRNAQCNSNWANSVTNWIQPNQDKFHDISLPNKPDMHITVQFFPFLQCQKLSSETSLRNTTRTRIETRNTT